MTPSSNQNFTPCQTSAFLSHGLQRLRKLIDYGSSIFLLGVMLGLRYRAFPVGVARDRILKYIVWPIYCTR